MARKYRRIARHIRLCFKRNVLQRAGPQWDTGVYRKPHWYPALLAVPPHVVPQKPAGAWVKKVIVFPTDELVKEHQRRNPQVKIEPLYQGGGKTPSVSYIFAAKQLELMRKGMDREEAYKQAELSMKAESDAKLLKSRKLVETARAVTGTGATPAFITDERIYNSLMEWRDMMNVKPYDDWEPGSKAALMLWIQSDVLGFTDDEIKTARSLADGSMEEIEQDAEALLHALFPGCIGMSGGSIKFRHRMNDADWLRMFQGWSRDIRKNPRVYLWDVDKRAELSKFVLRECMDQAEIHSRLMRIQDEKSAEPLVWEVHTAKLKLFPGIRLRRLQTPVPLPPLPIPDDRLLDLVPRGKKYEARKRLAEAKYEGQDERERQRFEILKREALNPMEAVLLRAARSKRRFDTALAAKAFTEKRAIEKVTKEMMKDTPKISSELRAQVPLAARPMLSISALSRVRDNIMIAENQDEKFMRLEMIEESQQRMEDRKRRRRARLEKQALEAEKQAEAQIAAAAMHAQENFLEDNVWGSLEGPPTPAP